MADDPLQGLLRAGAADAAKRADFYRALLQSELIAIGNVTQEGEKQKVAFAHFDIAGDCVPIFTSVEALSAAIQEKQPWVGINGQILFTTLPGQRFVLNPGSDCPKELNPDEIAALLDGSIYGQL